MAVPFITSGQTDWSYSISLLKESFFYPSKYTFQGPFHPGIVIGAEKLVKEKAKSDRLLTADLGFYHHDYLQNGVFIMGGYQYRGNPVEDLFIWIQPQLGYLHSFSPSGEWKLKNGEYEPANSGRPAALAGLTFGLDYMILKTSETKISLTYRALAEGPFAPAYGVPVAPHTFITMGIKSKLTFK